jgi:hypothetical protein
MILTPRAEQLVGPLHKLLVDTERLLAGGTTFDPTTAERRFVIAAPDFLATLLLPPLLDAAAREAPGVSFEIVPSARRGNAWLLPPLAGQPGPFSLGGAGVMEDALRRAGFRDVKAETIAAPLRMKSAAECLRFEKESFGALHQMLSSLDAVGRDGAWSEVGDALRQFEHGSDGFVGPCELVLAVGTK